MAYDYSGPYTRRRPGGLAIATLGTLISLAALVVPLLIGLALCLDVFVGGHEHIVRDIHKAGNWLAQPFHDTLTHWHGEDRKISNWGLAAAVYLAGGLIIGTLLRIVGAEREV